MLGYSPVVGARFYGIGNEYMGLLVGSTILTTAILCDLAAKKREIFIKWGIPFYYMITAIFIVHPKFGANVGDVITTTVGFGVSYLLLSGKKLSWKIILYLFLAILLIFTLLILVDLQREEPSHLAKSILAIAKSGPVVALLIISRKVSMNLKLMQYSRWTWVLASMTITGLLLFKEPQGVLINIFQRYPFLRLGLMGILAAAIVALIFNDSGIVAAATTLLVPGTGLLYLVLETRKEDT